MPDLPALGLKLGLDVVRRRTIDDTLHKTWLVFPGQVTALAQVEDELDRQVTAAQAEAQRLASARSQQLLAQKRERIRRTAAREAHLMQEAAQEAAAQRTYRDLSSAQKELMLRRALNLEEEWP
ncbi:hypothetical protein KY495_12950 [Massilia sp. PAMC28688]|uniref:hypothetical protein n=1 Tax=Massilia sp. PAMC28688 TaxID=2861283 RepID=UPI001C62FB51|nr:hypothetical protein [Massilia sp. PAMC28688]QYF91710.1 hypothetical protein KY495_12950 [Massilia sp. PAMC28688]